MQDLLHRPLNRIILFFVLFAALVMLPWWIAIPIIVAITIYLPMYLEALVFGFIFDALYSGNFKFPYVFLTSAAVFLVLLIFIKDRIRT